MRRSFRQRAAATWCWVAFGCGAFGFGSIARADVPELVGRLMPAVRPGAAERVGLSPEGQKELRKLVDQRVEAGTELMLQAKDLPPEEQDARLAPFRAETEALAKKLLSPEDWKKVEQAGIREQGLRSLQDPELAGKLNLTVTQQQARDKITADFERQAVGADEATRAKLAAEADRKLRQWLNPEQYAAWQQAAGELPGAPAVGAPAVAAPLVPATTAGPVPATTAPATTAPATTATAGTAAPAGTAPIAAPAPVKPAPVALGPNGERLLRFNFRFQPWGEVLDWFATQADLSLVMDAPPPGTFNYTDQRAYTPAQAIDLLNGVLLTKGFTLVRRERMVMLVNLEDGIPANLVPYVALEKLDTLGEFEVIKVLFPLSKMTPAEAELEVKPLLGPQGTVISLVKAKQLLVTDTAGRLKTVRSVLQAMESPGGTSGVKVYVLKHAELASVLDLIKQLADIPLDRTAALDGSLRLALDAAGNRILAGGTAEKLTRLEEILKIVDVPEAALAPSAAGPLETPQLEVYPVTSADPASVLAVLQTLFAGNTDVRLATDPKTGSIVALARPTDHATIKATLGQMQRDARKVEVFRLRSLDAASAVLSINKLFGGGEGASDPTAPKVDSDATSGSLFVRGTEAQLEQIRNLLEKLGEAGGIAGMASEGSEKGNVRMLPLSGRAGRNALEQIQQLWPTLRANRIRVVAAPDGMPMQRPGGEPLGTSSDLPAPDGRRLNVPGAPGLPGGLRRPEPGARPAPQGPAAPATIPSSGPTTAVPPPVEGRTAATDVPVEARFHIRLVGQATVQPAPAAGAAEAKPGEVKPGEAKPADPQAAPGAGSDIVVIPGANGLMIASDDLEALDEFEALLATLSSRSFTGGRDYTIFYLKSANAANVAETLESLLNGTASASGGDGGGSLIGDLAGMALGGGGGGGGGLLGGLLGLGGGGGSGGGGGFTTSGSLRIVPELRLNALIVQGSPQDLDAVEQLLRVLDQERLPESNVSPKPRLIAVKNQPAAEIAETIKSAYSERLVGGAAGNRQRQPSPEEFIQMLRGGRGGNQRGGAGAQRKTAAEEMKLSVSVDARTNSLIVVAPQPLFEEVEQLVSTLDVASEENAQTTRVVAVKKGNAYAVQSALSAITGQQAKGATAPASGSANRGGSTRPRTGGAPGANPQMDFFNALRGMGGQGGGGGRGGAAPGGGFGGGQGGGGFGGGQGGTRGGRGGR